MLDGTKFSTGMFSGDFVTCFKIAMRTQNAIETSTGRELGIKGYGFTLRGVDYSIDDMNSKVKTPTTVSNGSLVITVATTDGAHVILTSADVNAMRTADRDNGQP